MRFFTLYVELLNEQGENALMVAAAAAYQTACVRNPCVQVLINAGSKVDSQDKEGNTALMKAAISDGAITEVLCKAGAEVNLKNNAGESSPHVSYTCKIYLRDGCFAKSTCRCTY